MFGKDCEPDAHSVQFDTHGLVDKKVTAEFLGVSRKTVEKLQREGLPYYKLGSRRNGYLIEEVKAWLTASRKVARNV